MSLGRRNREWGKISDDWLYKMKSSPNPYQGDQMQEEEMVDVFFFLARMRGREMKGLKDFGGNAEGKRKLAIDRRREQNDVKTDVGEGNKRAGTDIILLRIKTSGGIL